MFFFLGEEVQSTYAYAYFNLVLKLISLVVFMTTYVYLLNMVLGVQKLFSAFRKREAQNGEIFFIALFFIFIFSSGLPNR